MIQIRTVAAAQGWQWLAGGARLFRRAPLQWLLLIGALFILSRILLIVPLIGLCAVLLTPNLIAGLMHGTQAIDSNKPLRIGYLFSGFLRHGLPLLVIGGLSLSMQFLILTVMGAIGGQNVVSFMDATSSGNVTPEMVSAVAPDLMKSLLAGLVLSIPVMMALWFAPLLVFFDNLKPLQALTTSLYACVKNTLPFLVYGAALLAPVLCLSLLTMPTNQPDLALWLLAPVIIPSIYVSYRDLFVQNTVVEPPPPIDNA